MKSEEEMYKDNFGNLLGLDSDEMRILESIRFRDQDLSTKGGALLAFEGLLIATSLVLLSADPGSVIAGNSSDITKLASFIGILLLFFSAYFSLASIVRSRKYSNNPHTALMQLYKLVNTRRRMVGFSSLLCVVGAVFVLSGLTLSLYPSIIHML